MLKIINHKMYTNNKIPILLLIISTLSLFNSRQIQIPALKDYTAINVKLGLPKQIKQPNFDFSKVYKRQVQKFDTHSTYRFGPCSQNKPQVQFEVLDKIIFEGIPTRPNVITNFDDIKYSQFLLDIYFQDLKIFMIFKNKKVAVITLENDDKIKDKAVFDVSGQTSEQFLEIGYFIKVDSYLLFVNSQYTILINDNSASVVPGYKAVDQFKSVISLQNSTFAVLDSLKGVNFYYFDKRIVKFVQNFQPPILKKPEFQDIVWWKQQKKLIVLDRMDGIKTLQLTFKFDPANIVAPSKTDANSKPTKNNIQIVNTQKIGPTDDCKLMYLYNTTLYVYCGTMTAYDLDKWPIIRKEALPFPNIEVKQIYQVDDIVAFVGRNVFSILYLNRMVNYYEDGNLDKLIFAKDLYISANEEGVDLGNYLIIKPYLTCYTNDQQFLGLSHLQFKTYAECNDTYFEDYGINKQMLGQIKPDDTCIYTVYKSINYWKVGQVKTIPILVAIIAIVLIIIISAIVLMIKKTKLNRVVTMIQQYSKVNNDSASAKPSHFIQQLDGDNNQKPNQNLQKQNKAENKPSEVQLGNINNI